jgi:hypothetical protein
VIKIKGVATPMLRLATVSRSTAVVLVVVASVVLPPA